MSVNNSCPVVLEDMDLFEYFLPFCNAKDGFACGSLSKRHNDVVQKVSDKATVSVIFQEDRTRSDAITIRTRRTSSISKVSCTIFINPRADTGIPLGYLAYIYNHISFVAVNFEGAKCNLLDHPLVQEIFCQAEAVQIAGTPEQRFMRQPSEKIQAIAQSLSMLPKCRATVWYIQQLEFLLALSEENLEGIEYISGEGCFTQESLVTIIANASKFRHLDGVKSCRTKFTFRLFQTNGRFPDVLSGGDLQRLNQAFSCKFWTKVHECEIRNILACVIWNGTLKVPPAKALVVHECWDDVWGSWQELYTRNRMDFRHWAIDFSQCAQSTKKLMVNPMGSGSHSKLFNGPRFTYAPWEEPEEDNMGVLRDVYLAFWERSLNSIGQNVVGVKGNVLRTLMLFDTDNCRAFVDALTERRNLRKWKQVERKLCIKQKGFGHVDDNRIANLLKQLLSE